MASKSTHVYKTVGDLNLRVDVYTRKSHEETNAFDPKQPVALFLHGGGWVAFDREHIPPHVIQSSLLRGWPLISADYRVLPQVKGADIFEDVKDAYSFVEEKVPGILAGKETEDTIENIILVGQSTGSYLSFLGGHYLQPRPTAILSYYGLGTINEPYLSKSSRSFNFLTRGEVEHYLIEAPNTSMTPPFDVFDPSCLLDDLSRNPDWKRPEIDMKNPADSRMIVLRWLIQEDGLMEWFKGVEVGLGDAKWRDFVPTVLMHGDRDEVAPYQGSVKVGDVVGPIPAKLFTAKGQPHSFDRFLYLGEPGLEAVEEAWDALEGFVKDAIAEKQVKSA